MERFQILIKIMAEMNKIITATVFVTDDNLDTDQILTAEFMKVNPSSEEGYKELGTLAMCGLPEHYPPFVNKETGKAFHKIILGGNNFGCGSSREHAPKALGSSGVIAVLANNFARIFYRNCISTGELIPIECKELDLSKFETGDEVEVNLETLELTHNKKNLKYKIEDFGSVGAIIEAGGIFPYAKNNNIY